MYRDITVRLAVDEEFPAPFTVDEAVAAIPNGTKVIVSSDADALEVLLRLGADSEHAKFRIRTAKGLR